MFRRVIMTTVAIRLSDMKTDFASWSQPNLANLAADQQAEIVRLNNELARTLVVLKGLMAEYERMGDVYCFVPARHEAYQAADRLLK